MQNVNEVPASGWGGARKGAGRKAKPKGKHYTFRSTPVVEKILSEVPGGKSDFINSAIIAYVNNSRLR